MIDKASIKLFYPTYPDINDESFAQEIYEKEELYKYRLERSEDPPEAGDFYRHQKIISRFMSGLNTYNELLLYHQLGTGKCFCKGTPILLYSGEIKNVEDIQIGDQLMGDDSTPRTVLSLAKGQDNMYDIINRCKGEKYNVNSEHILCLKASGFPSLSYRNNKKNHSYNVQWIEDNEFQSRTFTFNEDGSNKEVMKKNAIKFKNSITNEQVLEIEVKDFLKLSKSKKEILKGYKVGVEFKEQSLPIEPYMIGYWLGDGDSNRSVITSQDSCVLHYFKHNLKQYELDLVYGGKYRYSINGYTGKVGSNKFLTTLKELNLQNNKHIPIIYKCNSRENRLKLLAGIIDSDGYRDGNSLGITLKDEKLMDDVIYLCRSLGFSCFKKTKKTSWTYKGEKKYGKAFRININGIGIEEIPTRIPRKKVELRKINKDALVNTIDVIHTGFNDYYGFTIDGNRRFLLGDFTVTHNTCTAIAVAELLNENNAIKKAIVITRGELLSRNFQRELVSVCTNRKYFPLGFEQVGDKYYIDNVEIKGDREESAEKKFWRRFVNRAKKTFKENYGFDTYYKFASKLKNMSNSEIIKEYNNHLFIMDEVHNMKLDADRSRDDAVDVYVQFKRMFDLLSYRKILLLSGTPMVDQPNEIAHIMNLMIKEGELPTGTEFNERFLRKRGDYWYVKDDEKSALGRYFKGRVSYLKTTESDVDIEYTGNPVGPLQFFNVFQDEMSQYQGKQYIKAFKADRQEDGGIYLNSRKASIMG